MRYQKQSAGTPYPLHNIDPKDKGADFCMQYAKAAYWDFNNVYPKGVFSSNGGDYERYRMYALGKQPVDNYKKWLGVDSITDNTWLSVSWDIRAIVSGYRDKTIARLMKEDFGFVCTPVDMLAKSNADNYYNQLKAKLAVRQMMLQQAPELASHPLISLQSGEPFDLEELEMRVELGEQFNRSKDAELAIELGMYENGYKAFRRAIFEDLFDYGVAGYKDWLGDDNKARFRRVNPDCVIISSCKDATFSDLIHAGEVIDVPLVELATLTDEEGNPMFTDKELQEFAGSIAGQFGNPTSFNSSPSLLMKPYNKFKCKVLDIEFFTYNDNVYRDAPDQNGNNDFRKAEYGRGKKSDKYIRKRYQYVYKCKWIIGTDKCYDWGMCYDQKRAINAKLKAKTSLSYKFTAYNFYEMRAQSFMEKLIPYIDDYQLTMLKIQNFKNRAVPSGWWIDLDALESVAMNKGGKNMTPFELLQMFFETGVLVGRSVKANGEPQSPNWKPVIPIENTAASELAMFYQDLLNTITTIEKMVGYNDVTMGQANPKTLVPGYQQAEQSTQEALFPLRNSEEWLSLQLAESVFCRMQQGIRKGEISGHAPYRGALGANTIRFISLDKDAMLRDMGIEIERKTSDDQKLFLIQMMQPDIQNGYLDSSDTIVIINTHNAKEAQLIFSFKVKRAKQQMQQDKMVQLQSTNEANIQSTQIASQTQLQILQMELMSKERMKQMEVLGELQKEQMRLESQERITLQSNYTKQAVAETTGQAKITSSILDGEAGITKAHIAGEKAKEKQEISNSKPQTTSSK